MVFSLPLEILHYVCSFLSEKDILSLSQTCHLLREIISNNTVWKRFVTEEMKSLRSRHRVILPFIEDPNLCENHQLVLMKNRLICNWRNWRFKEFKFSHEIIPPYRICGYKYKLYKENYLMSCNLEGINFWDIGNIWGPVLYYKLSIESKCVHLIGDYLVIVRNFCSIEVYKMDIEQKSRSFLYVFSVVEDKIFDGVVHHGYNECCNRWICHEAGNYLVFTQRLFDDRYPDIHIWDIANAQKVGVFTSQVRCHHVRYLHLENNCLYFTSGLENLVCLKFDLTARRFNESVISVTDSRFTYIMFYKDHCIVMKGNWEGKSVDCEVFEFKTSSRIKARHFENTGSPWQKSHIVDGKLVIFSPENFHVVDALTLDTVVVVGHGRNFHKILCQTSVFGSIFLVTNDKDGAIKMWDLEKATFTLLKKALRSICGSIFSIIVHGEDPVTKFVALGEIAFVVHFW